MENPEKLEMSEVFEGTEKPEMGNLTCQCIHWLQQLSKKELAQLINNNEHLSNKTQNAF